MRPLPAHDRLFTPQEVAAMLAVDAKTVTRWAKQGKIPESAVVRTLGGHRRFLESYVRSLLPPLGSGAPVDALGGQS